MKIVLIDKFAKIVYECTTGDKEPCTVATYNGEAYIFRANRSNDRRWTYQVVSTYPCQD